jgi:hypothetical protein
MKNLNGQEWQIMKSKRLLKRGGVDAAGGSQSLSESSRTRWQSIKGNGWVKKGASRHAVAAGSGRGILRPSDR